MPLVLIQNCDDPTCPQPECGGGTSPCELGPEVQVSVTLSGVIMCEIFGEVGFWPDLNQTFGPFDWDPAESGWFGVAPYADGTPLIVTVVCGGDGKAGISIVLFGTGTLVFSGPFTNEGEPGANTPVLVCPEDDFTPFPIATGGIGTWAVVS